MMISPISASVCTRRSNSWRSNSITSPGFATATRSSRPAAGKRVDLARELASPPQLDDPFSNFGRANRFQLCGQQHEKRCVHRSLFVEHVTGFYRTLPSVRRDAFDLRVRKARERFLERGGERDTGRRTHACSNAEPRIRSRRARSARLRPSFSRLRRCRCELARYTYSAVRGAVRAPSRRGRPALERSSRGRVR